MCVVMWDSFLLALESCSVDRDFTVLWLSSYITLNQFRLVQKWFCPCDHVCVWGLVVRIHPGNEYCSYDLWFGRSGSNAQQCINWAYMQGN